MMHDLRKIKRKIRRKLGVGLVRLLGPENAASEVKNAWLDKRSPEWVKNYDQGIQNPDWVTGESNLAKWYRILEDYVSPRLADVVADVYDEAKKLYRREKRQEAERMRVERAEKGLAKVIEVVTP